MMAITLGFSPRSNSPKKCAVKTDRSTDSSAAAASAAKVDLTTLGDRKLRWSTAQSRWIIDYVKGWAPFCEGIGEATSSLNIPLDATWRVYEQGAFSTTDDADHCLSKAIAPMVHSYQAPAANKSRPA